MGAAEDQGVAARRQQRLHVGLEQRAGRRRGQRALFDALHQPRAGLGDHLHVAGEAIQQRGEAGALQRAGGGQHAHRAAAGRRRRRLDRRLHADDRQPGVALAQFGHRRRGGGVAGQHQRLGALAEEEVGDAPAALADVFGTLLAVGHVAAVGDVQQRLGRQPRADLAEHRQAADPGIEYPDRRRATHVAHRRPRIADRA